ncbi:MAG: non-ribosomal peptide synthetase, partial [Acidobacteria bacterium]|nr:non-ribosomal peptide synthetase [Acidobacteriota bacterium]
MTEHDLSQQLAQLPPEKRALLFEKLRQQKAAQGKTAAPAPALARVPRDAESYTLSFAQQRLWFLYHFEPDSPEYNVPQAYRLHGPLDPALLQRALAALVERHEVLRTSFRAIEGEGRQAVAAEAPPDLTVTDLADRSPAEAEEAAAAAMTADARTPFDLAVAPPLRAKLFRLGAQEHLLYLNVHHIAFDGWSQGVLVG